MTQLNKAIIWLFGCVFVVWGQPQSDQVYKLLDETITVLNPAVHSKTILDELNNYIQMYPDSPSEDEILYKIAHIHGINKEVPSQLVNLIKLLVLHADSPLKKSAANIIDSLITYNTELITNSESETAFRELPNLMKSTSYRQAYLKFLSFLFFSDIQMICNPLVKEIIIYRQLFKTEQKDFDAVTFWQAIAHEKMGAHDQAIYYLKIITVLYPDSRFVPASLLGIANIYTENKKNYEKASVILFNLINQYPEVAETGEAQFRLALLYDVYLKNETEALNNYKILVQSFPANENYMRALTRIAAINEKKMNYEEAINYYKLIIENGTEKDAIKAAFLKIATIQQSKLNQPVKAAQTFISMANTFTDDIEAAGYLLNAAKIYSSDAHNAEKFKEVLKIITEKYAGSKEAKEAQTLLDE
jgi:TolA-binding protein